jgi:serine protease Do
MRGEPVIAIGNPYGYHHTVTEGIISALHRDIPVNGVQDYPDLIQTDASINPGNSGGPLLNAEGHMIGLNAAVRMGAQGIGFAIPVDRATEVAADLIVQHRRDGFDDPLDVRTDYQAGTSCVTVVRSRQSDVESGDIIAKVNGQRISNRLQYELALVGHRTGSAVEVELLRSDRLLTTAFRLESTRGGSRTQLASARATSIRDLVYSELGIHLEPANPQSVRNVDSSYKGGLRVTAVRQDSPAYAAQIQTGDILVGLLEWQTPNWDDLEWIMKSKEMRTADAPKFHIMRNSEVYWGTLDLNHASSR